jgi:uncharacterized protein
VMGPWAHGGWSRTDGDRLGNARFGEKTSLRYRKDMELAFFEHFLRDKKLPLPAEANVFDTGANEWRTFDAWPPAEAVPHELWISAPSDLLVLGQGPKRVSLFNGPPLEFVSDPAHPVPFTASIATGMTKEYMTDDQRFVATRPDVLVYRTNVLDDDLTLAGPLDADLVVSTSGTDSDWIVKLIDEFPGDAQDPKDAEALSAGEHLGGFQMLVRSEVMRGRFRDGAATPKAFVPDQKTELNVHLQDVLHTFRKGHRLVIQIHCTWFPLVDRNPQTFVPSIYDAKESDFVAARQRVYQESAFRMNVLPAAGK